MGKRSKEGVCCAGVRIKIEIKMKGKITLKKLILFFVIPLLAVLLSPLDYYDYFYPYILLIKENNG